VPSTTTASALASIRITQAAGATQPTLTTSATPGQCCKRRRFRSFPLRRSFMTRAVVLCKKLTALLVGSASIALSSIAVQAQLVSFSKQDLIDFTAQNRFDRLPDGRPKVPDDLIQRARELSSEEV